MRRPTKTLLNGASCLDKRPKLLHLRVLCESSVPGRPPTKLFELTLCAHITTCQWLGNTLSAVVHSNAFKEGHGRLHLKPHIYSGRRSWKIRIFEIESNNIFPCVPLLYGDAWPDLSFAFCSPVRDSKGTVIIDKERNARPPAIQIFKGYGKTNSARATDRSFVKRRLRTKRIQY